MRGARISSPAMSGAVVFAGGGSLGAVEVGMLEALLEHGTHAALVVGASAGAINATYYAGRPDAAGVEFAA
jgi:NTE family protein